MRMRKGQTAMEYLMTYGWAILIIMVVLAVLFYLGVLNPPVPSQCTFPAGISCISTKLGNIGGNLTLVIGQGVGHTIVITGVNCSNNMTTGFSPMVTYIGSTAAAPVNITMNSGSQATIASPTSTLNTTCQGVSGATIGGTYVGKIYINYTEVDTGINHIVVGSYTAKYESG
jgi:hypothetical protein